MRAATVAGQPLNSHSKGLLPGHRHIAGGMWSGLLYHKRGAGRQGGNLIVHLK